MGRGLNRRAALKAAAGAMGVASQHCGAPGPGSEPLGGAGGTCIWVWLKGGPSQLETFDPKPGTRAAGPFRAIATSAKSVMLGEHLPALAERAHTFALLRSLVGEHDAHASALCTLRTSARASGLEREPFMPRLCEAARGRDGLSLYQRLGDRLPDAVEPEAAWRARADEDFVTFAPALAKADLAAATIADGPVSAAGVDGLAASTRRALALASAGITCIEIVHDGWDLHGNAFDGVLPLLASLDAALSGLLDGLHERDLWARTALVVCGEFGRTPTINAHGGRDHHPAAFSALLAGGGIRPGVTYGATDAQAERVVDRPASPADLLATVAAATGLPEAAPEGGRVLAGLLA